MDRLVMLSDIDIIMAGSCMDFMLNNPVMRKQIPADKLPQLIKTRDLFEQLNGENAVINEGMAQ